MGVRSFCLGYGTALPTSAAALYTAASGRTVIIKQLNVYNATAAVVNAEFRVGIGTNQTRIWRGDVGIAQAIAIPCFVVLDHLMQLRGRAAAAGIEWTAFGANLVGDPT